ncbi:MAG: transporter substrate-binding domain-containing protein [Betaproteobacteria bacterium]|nr:MAG: transporter substrate-binding domain-containing protein [Betaproteobacteria bacterium]
MIKSSLTRWIGGAFLYAVAVVGFNGEIAAQSGRPPGVPEAGKSERIDEILKRGTLKVGVTPSFPWLFRNKTGKGDEYRGSSWVLAKAYADALGVKLEPVQVSNETKVPIVVSGGVDITISSLAETDARKQVVDFVTYSQATFCIFGLKTNPKAAAVKNVGELDSPDLTFAAYVGTNQAAWIPKTFPKAKMRGVTGSGQAPVDELLAGRADFVVGDSPLEPIFKNAHKNMLSIPADCSKSDLNPVPVGQAVAKNQPAFLEFLRGIEKKVEPKVKQEEIESIKFAREFPDQI